MDNAASSGGVRTNTSGGGRIGGEAERRYVHLAPDTVTNVAESLGIRYKRLMVRFIDR